MFWYSFVQSIPYWSFLIVIMHGKVPFQSYIDFNEIVYRCVFNISGCFISYINLNESLKFNPLFISSLFTLQPSDESIVIAIYYALFALTLCMLRKFVST